MADRPRGRGPRSFTVRCSAEDCKWTGYRSADSREQAVSRAGHCPRCDAPVHIDRP